MMLILQKQKYFYCFILLISVLLYTNNLLCKLSSKQEQTYFDNYTNNFNKSYNIFNKITDKYFPVIKTDKKQHKTYFSEAEKIAPWSNAFNFKKSWGTSVDPRTGILSAHVKTGSLLSNFGHGPDIDLEINYNSNTLANPDGLGAGWRWNLTHFNLITHQLTTSFGQNFYLKKQPDGRWWPQYHKLHDIRITGDISTHFVITYANGLRETLNHEGYEICLEQQDGWRVYFNYIPGTHLLRSVVDDERNFIILRRSVHYITVISHGNKGQPVAVLLCQNSNEIQRIMFLSFGREINNSIYIHYVQHFITHVDYPSGLSTRLMYNCKDAMRISEKDTASIYSLCVVVKKTINPGFGEPVMISRYRYSQININAHNYLGFNAGIKITKHSAKDILFRAPINYTYKTEQDNGIIREIYTYNKYHLLIYDQKISDHTEHILSETHYFFCRIDENNGCTHTSFANLPTTYSLPLKIVTKLWSDVEDIPVTTTTIVKYDSQGRVVWKKDPYGRITAIHYCPLTGNEACPPASAAWSFSTLTESTTLYPAHIKSNENLSDPLITYNYYHKEKNHNGSGYMLVLDHQVQQSGKQQLITTSFYYHNPDNLLTYGLLKQTVFTDNQNKTASLASIIKDYYYIKSLDGCTKTTYSMIELSAKECQFSSYITTSLFTNQVLEVNDICRTNIIHYYYDEWDRLIKTESAPGTVFAASIYYCYTISPTLNQVLMTAPNGLQQKIIFDGAGRIRIYFTETIDTNGKQQYGHWRPIQKSWYDQYGRITKISDYNIDEKGNVKATDITRDYDETGRAIRTYLPDGGISFTAYDDVDRCLVNYQKNRLGEYSVLVVSLANVLNKPVKQWVLPSTIHPPFYSIKSLCLNSDKKPAAKVSEITYDGFGRRTTVKDPSGRIIRQRYDSLGRIIDIINPFGDRIHQVYDITGETIQSWAYPSSGGHYLLSSAGYNAAGQLRWSAREDGKHTFYTYTENGRLAMVTTPGKHTFIWKYNILGLPVSQFTDNKVQWSCCYDPVTLKLQKKTDNTGVTTYNYSDDGLLQTLVHTGYNSYLNYRLHWQYDSNRRIISTTDISGNKLQSTYDSLNRITSISYLSKHKRYAEVIFKPVYDAFSRINAIEYGSHMHRTIHYNAWGYKDQMTDIQGIKLISQWQFEYGVNGNIIALKQTAENNKYSLIRYRYDALGNLITMICSGSSGLPLCPHDTAFSGSGLIQSPVITRQDYTFTSLNRISSVREILQNIQHHTTIKKVMNYLYTNFSVPLRLQKINTVWNNSSAVMHNFVYDKSGNMIVDGQENHITYNAMNEITNVISRMGMKSNYVYDGSGKQVMEKNMSNVSYLFYRGDRLINEKIMSPGESSHITGYLGIAKTIDGMISEYYENSYKGDITGIFKKQDNKSYRFSERNIYSPYGMIWHGSTKTKPWYQQTLQGFDGERTDPVTKWQFLGQGHRTYNPQQRYFVSEDPAGDGYAFGSNNPVMNTDPSGNSPEWLGSVVKWAGYISTLGLSALNQRWANITASVIQAGLSIVSMGAAVAGAGSAALAGVITGTAAVSSIPVVAAALPANKGLNIAASIIGLTEMAVTVVATVGNFFASFGEAVEGAELSVVPFCMLKSKNGNWTCPPDSEFFSGSLIGVDEDTLIASLSTKMEATIAVSSLNDSAYYIAVHALLLTNLSNCIEGETFLKTDTLKGVVKIWHILRFSSFQTNIACDTGAILFAAHFNKKNILISQLVNFLCKRRPFVGAAELFTQDHPYLCALKTILYTIKAPRAEYHTINSGNLRDVFKRQSVLGAVINGGDGHIAVMLRNTAAQNLFDVYQFNSDGTLSIIPSTIADAALVFWNSSVNKVIINGYMRIG